MNLRLPELVPWPAALSLAGWAILYLSIGLLVLALLSLRRGGKPTSGWERTTELTTRGGHGLVGGYFWGRYYLGRFSLEVCLWSMVLALVINYTIGALSAVTTAFLRPRLEGLPRTKRLWFEVPASVSIPSP